MTRWKRVGLSLLSAVIAELLMGFAFSVPDGKHLFFERAFGFAYLASYLVIPGWLIALPIIVIPNKAAHRPTWQLGLIGSSIGPGIMFAIGTYFAIANHSGIHYKREAWYLAGLAALISVITTATYLTCLKLFGRPTPTPST
jgi:hypothetical protein